MDADLVIRGGTVVDGTGAPGYRADVAVRGGTITEIGERLDGRRVLEADGHIVAPGFLDIHTHYDAQVFWDPELSPSSWHGVTSVVAGNCGFSIAPCREEHRDLIARTLHHVEDMSVPTLKAGIPWDFATFPEYLASVERHGTVVNFTAYIGHTALRLFVMGDEAYEREAATDDELARMAAAVREAVEAGSAGFSTTAAPTHSGDGGRPVPSRLSDLREFETLITPLGQLGQGIVEVTPGGAWPTQDLADIQLRTGVPITWTALLTRKGSTYLEDVLAQHARGIAAGARVWPQITVRPLTFRMTMADPFVFNMRPSFAALMDRPLEARLAAFGDPAWREQALSELEDSDRFFHPD